MMGLHPNKPIINLKYYLVKMNLIHHSTDLQSLATHGALGCCVFTPRILWLLGSCGLLLLLATLGRQWHIA